MIDFNPDAFDPAPSPCINVCQMDVRTGLCTGCQRTIEEIVAWGGASDTERRAVWREIVRRRNAMFDDDAA